MFQTASVLILPLIFDVDGIWYAITVAEVFATLISVIFLFAKRKSIITWNVRPTEKNNVFFA